VHCPVCGSDARVTVAMVASCGSALGTVAVSDCRCGSSSVQWPLHPYFTERLARWSLLGRRTQRLTQWLVHIAVALAGTAGHG